MSGTDIVIWILTIAALVCIGTICVMICVISKLNRMVDIRDKSIGILGETAEKDFKEIVRWQSEYMDAEAKCDKLTIANKQLKAEYDDILNKYDVVYAEYGYCRQERDDYKKRLEKYEHNVI